MADGCDVSIAGGVVVGCGDGGGVVVAFVVFVLMVLLMAVVVSMLHIRLGLRLLVLFTLV